MGYFSCWGFGAPFCCLQAMWIKSHQALSYNVNLTLFPRSVCFFSMEIAISWVGSCPPTHVEDVLCPWSRFPLPWDEHPQKHIKFWWRKEKLIFMGCPWCLRRNRSPSATRKKTKKGFKTFASLNKLGGNQDLKNIWALWMGWTCGIPPKSWKPYKLWRVHKYIPTIENV